MSEIDEPIRVVPYDPRCPDLGRELVGIDVQVGCAAEDGGRVVQLPGRVGFEHLGRPGGPGREYLRRRVGQVANVAVVERQGSIWADNIAFRDYLRAHPAAAARYAHAKARAVSAAGMLTAYSALKAATVREIM